ncbi:MAG: extracellular solute-binding protein [Thermomicrobiales bacterium]|nr:extracellular solute-binding protein [Thermomicrobiales bacterium]
MRQRIHEIDRRRFLTSAALGAGAAMVGGPVRAQGDSGTLRVGFEENQPASLAAMEAAAALVMARHPDVRFEFEPAPPGSFLIQLVLQLTMGRGPDLFMLSGSFLGELASAGFALPLDDYLASWDGWAEVPERFRASLTWNGSVWGMPHQMDSHFLYYRRDIFAAAGLPVDWQPASPDEILDVAATIKAALPDVIPFALHAGANAGLETVGRGFVPVLLSYGGDFKDENGLWIIDGCAIRQTMHFYERAYVIDQTVPQEVMTDSSPVEAMRAAMLDGSLAMIHEGSWAYGEWLSGDPETARDQIAYALMPASDGSGNAVLSSPGNTLFANARTYFPDIAWEFIAEMNTLEQQVAVNVADPHIPSRLDAQAALGQLGDPFLSALMASTDALRLFDPDPAVRDVVTIIQSATGAVASGEAGADEVVDRYASELTRAFGEENVVMQPCNAEV